MEAKDRWRRRAAVIALALALTACAGPNHVTRGGMDQIARDLIIIESREPGTARGIYE